MEPSLPVEILAGVNALGTTLARWAQTHRDATLAEAEAGVLAAVRSALPGLLGAVVHASVGDLDVGVAGVGRRCPRCARRTPRQGTRSRRVQTTCGTLTLRRSWYSCAACGHGFSPVDSTLGLSARVRISPQLSAWMVTLGTSTTSREAATLLHDLTGLAVAADTIRAHTTNAGSQIAATEDGRVLQVVTTRDAAEPVDAAPGTLVVETDGVMIRYQDGWHEVKVGLVGGTTPAGDLTAVSYSAARQEAAVFGGRLLAEAARRGALDVVDWEGGVSGRALARLRPVHVLGDGAPWIWNVAAEHFGERTEAVDFYHASEHLWAVARALYGADTAEATGWATTWRAELYDHGSASLRTALHHARPPVEGRETLRRERGYFATNAARMDYPALRAQHLPIGSGAVESCAKHLVQHRMKRPGQRWSPHGARAMLALRARRASLRPLPSFCPDLR